MNEQFLKLLLIGDSGVGKSCILMRFCENTFIKAFYNTIGVEFKTKHLTLEGTKCKMQIWDTAGQQRFRTITANYYKGAHGILVVFDLTSKQSFKNVEYWLEEIDKHGTQGVIKILVGNKCDDVNKRQVSEIDAEMFAKNRQIQYIEVSAFNAANVNLVFETIGKHILHRKKGGNSTNMVLKNQTSENQGIHIRNSMNGAKQNLKNKCC